MPIESELSRNQMVVPFGVGASYDYLNFSAISLLTDYWEIPNEGNTFNGLKLNNPRLIQFVNKRLKNLEGEEFKWVPYILKPPFLWKTGMPRDLAFYDYPMPVNKFPRYYVCPRCSNLSQPHPTNDRRQRCENHHKPDWLNLPCKDLKQYRRPFLEPVRFIGFCEDGHLQDVPWRKIMKAFCENSCGEMDKRNALLYLKDDGNGFGFASLNISCGKCKKRKNLTGLNSKDRDKYFKDQNDNPVITCEGEKPWDPEEKKMKCEKHLHIEPRAASKIYIPEQESGLYIPNEREERHPIKDENNYQTIAEQYDGDEEKLKILVETLLMTVAQDLEPPLSLEQIVNLIKDEKNEKDKLQEAESIDVESEKDDFYREEFVVLKSDLTTDDYVSLQERGNFSDFVKKYLTSIHAIKKLKETTVLLGFTRGAKKFNPARKLSKFLPAYEVSGEGIFIDVGYEKVKQWLDKNSEFKKNKKILLERSKLDFRTYPDLYSEPGFIMLHTLSHALIRQLSLESGYGLNELKERIYFSHKHEMAGFLIYTSSSDSSGSMGGLVRRASPELFSGTFENAVNNSIYCSNDPICSDSQGQGLSGLSFAACHACSMIPDLACEIVPKNTFLDRNMLIGTKVEGLGYFS